MNRARYPLIWREAHWPRPLSPDQALEVLHRIATEPSLGTVTIETRARGGVIRFLLAVAKPQIGTLTRFITTLAPGTQITKPTGPRRAIATAGRVTLSHPSLALSTDRVLAITRAVLASLAAAKGTENEVVLQVILGERLSPQFLPGHAPDPRRHWLELLSGGVHPASSDIRASLKDRSSHPGFKAAIRIGAISPTAPGARSLLLNLFGGLRVSEAVGTRLHLTLERPDRLNSAKRPFHYPLKFSTTELVSLLGWPLGDGTLPGLPDEHPRLLAPPPGLKGIKRAVASSSAPGAPVPLGISPRDALFHTVLLGPTGSGKSTAMLALIEADMNAGRSVLVIDPKADLVREVMARIPANRHDDVVVIDPISSTPVGLNPLVDANRNPELVADTLLASFKSVFADSWGVRSEDILSASLITLARTPGANLVWLPALLSDRAFRRRIVKGINDPLGVGAFWAKYEAKTPQQQAAEIAPVLNKLRQFLIRPAMRAVLGQSDPLFNLGDLFTSRKIVLISLNKGILGPESARLLGSLVVGQLWPLILGRSSLPAERRHIVSVFIDEVQDYLSLPTDLADALAQSRSLGVAFHLAHQYRAQLPGPMRAAIDANARNKVVFGLNATDAGEMAKMAPRLDAQDFMLLPKYAVYMTTMNRGQSTGWVSGTTLPPSIETSNPAEIKAASALRYGRPANEVESDVLRVLGLTPTLPTATDEPIGRRRKS